MSISKPNSKSIFPHIILYSLFRQCTHFVSNLFCLITYLICIRNIIQKEKRNIWIDSSSPPPLRNSWIRNGLTYMTSGWCMSASGRRNLYVFLPHCFKPYCNNWHIQFRTRSESDGNVIGMPPHGSTRGVPTAGGTPPAVDPCDIRLKRNWDVKTPHEQNKNRNRNDRFMGILHILRR